MKKPPEDQLQLPIPDTAAADASRRPTRRRFPDMSRRSVPVRRAVRAKDTPLLQTPEQIRCGFCGLRMTVLEEAAVCESCGSIVARDAEED